MARASLPTWPARVTVGASGSSGDAFAYDMARRLTTAWMGSATPSNPTSAAYVKKIEYNMDDDGNRSSVVVTPYQQSSSSTSYTDNSLNQYTAVGGVNQAHDGNGNLKDDGTYLYEYNYRSLLCRVKLKSDNSTVATYKHDALGRRVEKDLGTSRERYVYSGFETVSVYDSTDTWVRDFVFGQGVDEPLMLRQADVTDFDGDQDTSEVTRHFYHRNALGSVLLLTDMNEAEGVSYRYDPYGAVTISVGGTPQSDDPLGNPWMFTSRFQDEETGLMYYRARHYAPGVGRFLQRDPLGYRPGPNLYEYCLSSPVRLCDPDGRNPLDWLKKLWRAAKEGAEATSKVGLAKTAQADGLAEQALKAAEESGLPGAHNGFQDAFRHCIWSCWMTRAIGAEAARKIGDVHEAHGDSYGQPYQEHLMDQMNNRKGRACGKICQESCIQCCMRLMRAGELAVLVTDSDGNEVAELVPYTGEATGGEREPSNAPYDSGPNKNRYGGYAR